MSERSNGAVPAQLIAGGYFALALALLLGTVTHGNWWLNHQLRLPALVLDAAVLGAVLVLPGLPAPAAAGLFMAIYAFVLLSAELGWPRRGALAAGLVVVAGYGAAWAALLLQPGHSGWLGAQLLCMIALAGFIVWLGDLIGKGRPPRLDLPYEGDLADGFAAVLDFAGQQADAAGLAIAWLPDDEPWAWVQSAGTLGTAGERLGPDQFAALTVDVAATTLFDRARQRTLQLRDDGALLARKGALNHPLPTRFGTDSGLMVTVPAQGGTCHLLLTDIHDPSADHLRLARAAGTEIGHALDRRTIMVVTRAADRIRVRDAVARDLHDSVAQSLAGASFRIEALRQALAGGKAIGEDLDALQHSLEREEHNVQRLILQLRDRDEPDRCCDLKAELAASLEDSAARWGIDWSLEAETELADVSLRALHELEQILREAVANAVRHGDARRVDVRVRQTGSHIGLDLSDDGQGFPARPRPLQPYSIAQRVAELAGQLNVTSGPGSTLLRVTVPIGAAA
ncbi:sensor histidine kinase [Novosphingobium sp.]|uniref:sensor histidine kinase n=1 Tax=Novosphingobium sp. TaxID=1874826 RepID=UPI002732A4B4|nr:ATP-binding protein [Novosphingobium sp.]MDP3908738.1 histidine kinase [Novosphingobium sp.]